MRIEIGNWDTATLELKYLKFLDPFKSVLSVLSVVRFGVLVQSRTPFPNKRQIYH